MHSKAPSTRVRARPRGPLIRMGRVAQYELAWDLKKLWVYLSAILLIILAIISVFVGQEIVSLVAADLPHRYSVTFDEKGLPAGTPWTVSIEGNPLFSSAPTSTTQSSVTFSLQNGTAAYAVGSLVDNTTDYAVTPATGTLDVKGSVLSVPLTFSRVPGTGGQISYVQAEGLAITAANSLGGNWTPVAAHIYPGSTTVPSLTISGTDLTSSTTNGSVPSNGACLLEGGISSWPTVPAWTGNYSNGLLTAWRFVFYQGLTDSEEFVTVQGGQASNIGYAAGLNCTGSLPSQSPLTSAPIDSSQAAVALLSSDHAYVTAHPQASAYFSLVNDSNSLQWLVGFTTCPASGGGTGADFTGDVSAVTGQVLGTNETNVTCPAPPSPTGANVPPSGPITSLFQPPKGLTSALGFLSSAETVLESPSFPATWWEDSVLMMSIFGFWVLIVGGVSSSESIARERDKGTLGALLSQPVRREEVFLGKFLAKVLIFLLLSSLYVGIAIGLSWFWIGPQTNLEWAPVAVLELTLAFLFFSAFALMLGCVLRRSRRVSTLLWATTYLSLGGLIYLYYKHISVVPLIFFIPGQSVNLPFAGTRAFIANPTGNAAVTYLPQTVAFVHWGIIPSASFALLSVVGLLTDTVLLLLLGLWLFRRLEAKD